MWWVVLGGTLATNCGDFSNTLCKVCFTQMEAELEEEKEIGLMLAAPQEITTWSSSIQLPSSRIFELR